MESVIASFEKARALIGNVVLHTGHGVIGHVTEVADLNGSPVVVLQEDEQHTHRVLFDPALIVVLDHQQIVFVHSLSKVLNVICVQLAHVSPAHRKLELVVATMKSATRTLVAFIQEQTAKEKASDEPLG